MNDLAEKTIVAHGGLDAWRRHKSVHAHLVQGGALWELKANGAQIADVGVTVATDRQWVSHMPFGATGLRSSFSKDRVAIESTDGRVVEELLTPRASFAGHQLSTPWTDLQLAFFVGCAMWTYLNVPFVLAWPEVESKDAGVWHERGESWHRLIVHYPPELEVFSRKQTLYIGEDGLLRRMDYNVEIAGDTPGAHYVHDYVEVAGIKFPSRRRIYPRQPDGSSLSEPLVVSIDLDGIALS
jgi:hypothetical protein